jgi:hypothetical protein
LCVCVDLDLATWTHGLHKFQTSSVFHMAHDTYVPRSICFLLFFIRGVFRDFNISHGMESPSKGRRQCKSTGFPFGAATGPVCVCVFTLLPASRAADPVTAPTATEKARPGAACAPAHLTSAPVDPCGLAGPGRGRGLWTATRQAGQPGRRSQGAQRGCR